MNVSAKLDFDAAEEFLRQARAAAAQGDEMLCLAARRMVAIALDLGLTPNGKIHTKHLREDAPRSGD